MIHLLDTDHITVLQRGGAGYAMLSRRLAQIAPDDYGTTVVNYEEQCRGWTDKINRANTPALRVHAYAELRESLRFFSGLSVWEYDDAADAQFVACTKATNCASEPKICVSQQSRWRTVRPF